MHGPINVKSSNNTSKWQMGFNSAFKGLNNMKFQKPAQLLFSGKEPELVFPNFFFLEDGQNYKKKKDCVSESYTISKALWC
jgi:hypothetical protein